MNARFLKILFLACFAVLAAAGFIWLDPCGLVRPLDMPSFVPAVPPELLEPAHEDSPEWVRRHVKYPGTGITEQVVSQRKDAGPGPTWAFHPNGLLKEYVDCFPDGRVSIQILYACDGKTPAGGFRLRPDGTHIWKGQTLADGTVEITSFWRDGKTPFARTSYKPGITGVETMFYRADGTRWVLRYARQRGMIWYETVFDEQGAPLFKKVWDKERPSEVQPAAPGLPADDLDEFRGRRPAGKLRGEDILMGAGGSETIPEPFRIDYLNAAGKVEFSQVWVVDHQAHLFESASKPNPRKIRLYLHEVEVYKLEGTEEIIQRSINLYSDRRAAKSVIEWGTGAQKTIKSLWDDGTISTVESYREDGSLEGTVSYKGSEGGREVFDARLFARPPAVPDPVASWRSREK